MLDEAKTRRERVGITAAMGLFRDSPKDTKVFFVQFRTSLCNQNEMIVGSFL